ncbi:MAG: aldo/keto reductase, partial [Deltaproteobacteria bacterium]|nr:aldo/keto reductase [Deltaproteobacteria bacterium]
MSAGLGAMRLSTDAERDEARGAEVIAQAIAAGVELIDTADAYGLSDEDVGHSERLIAGVLARLDEDVRARVQIATKGGLERPGGAWVPNGRARHLQAAAAASCARLGRVPELYLLHAVDPGTPLATSVRALARIREAGHAKAIGLANVTPTQLEAALGIAEIAAVEVELHPHKLDALRGGLVRMCEERGIRVLAHRPLGGPAGVARLRRDRELAAIAAVLGATPEEVVLAWLRTLSPAITTLPGPTRPATVASIARAAALQLDDDARTALAARYLSVVGGHRRSGPPVEDSTGRTREIVMIAGMPASGKSTLAEAYAARGYARLNRDERGGSLLDLARALDAELAAGAERIVVDNTYGTRAQRGPVVEIARAHGVPIRCTWVATPIEQAQAHAAARLLARHGRLLEEHEHAGEILPRVLHRFARDAEPPRADEGFDAVDEVVPARAPTGTRRALILELDGVLCRRRPLAAADVAVA